MHLFCNTCGTHKPIWEFVRDNRTSMGVGYICKKCNAFKRHQYNKNYMKLYRKVNKEKISNYNKQRYLRVGKKRNITPKKYWNLYVSCGSVYVKKISLYYDVLIKNNVLTVRCDYCGKLFAPTRQAVSDRLKAINRYTSKENKLYCSEQCKSLCSVFNRRHKTVRTKTRRVYQPAIKKYYLSISKNVCFKCGSTVGLNLHHISPVSINPIEEADVDNLMVLCNRCHNQVHSKGWCKTENLRC